MNRVLYGDCRESMKALIRERTAQLSLLGETR